MRQIERNVEMREKLKTLPLAELRELAKSQGIKGISTMKKADLIDVLCEAAEQKETKEEAPAPVEKAPAAQENSAPRQSEPAPARQSYNRNIRTNVCSCRPII